MKIHELERFYILIVELLLLNLFVSTVYAQFSLPPSIHWAKLYGSNSGAGDNYLEAARSIKKTTEGGYIIVGNATANDGDVSGNHGLSDYWIVKTDSVGNLQWQKCFGGRGDDVARSVQQTTDGGFIIAGHSNSTDGDVTGNHGMSDFWIVKTDNSGRLEWQKCIGGTGYDESFCIQQTRDGGYIVSGYTASTDGDVSDNHGGFDEWLVKLDGTGELKWQKCFGGTLDEADPYAGSTVSVQQTRDSGFIILGITYSNDGDVSGNHGSSDYWLIKTNDIGNIQWQKCYGGSNPEFAFSVEQTADEGYILAGTSASNDGNVTSNQGYYDSWLAKTDVDGNLQWQKSLGGSSDDRTYSVQQISNHNYIAAGYSDSDDGDVNGNHGKTDYWLFETDSVGNLLWQKCMGGSFLDEAYQVLQTENNNFIICGFTASFDGDVIGNQGGFDYWIVNVTQKTEIPLPVSWGNFTIDKNGNTVLLKWNTLQEQNADKYIVERSVDGFHFYVIGSVTAKGNSNTSSNYQFNDVAPLSGINFYRLKQEDRDGTYTYSKILPVNFRKANNKISISPNPVKNLLCLNISWGETLAAPSATATVNIYSAAMQLMQSEKITQVYENATIISVEKLVTGIYFLQFVNADRISIVKFVKE